MLLPYRRAGLLCSTFQRNCGRDDARVLVWKASTIEMNPQVDPAIIAEAYEDDPESAASEYGAEFRTDIADFVSRSIVEACIEPGCHERPAMRSDGRQYVAFIDAAGGSGADSMTCAIAHAENGTPVLDAIRERRPPFSPAAVVLEFAELLQTYGILKVESDKWGGDWVGESFRQQLTPRSKRLQRLEGRSECMGTHAAVVLPWRLYSCEGRRSILGYTEFPFLTRNYSLLVLRMREQPA